MDSDRPLRALVTAGGTREPIDDVRKVTNISSGRFGIEIAKLLAEAGVEVQLLLGHTAQLHARDLKHPRITKMRFDSFADLDYCLKLAAFSKHKPDIIFMAAAVSDYTPVAEEGKISSDKDELIVRMKKNPKLLSAMREQFGIETFIVGFKLLSGVTSDELISVAYKQVRKCRINLCLANDLASLKTGQHPAFMVTPEGGALPLNGDKTAVARGLVDFVLQREAVRWFKSTRTEPDTAPENPPKQITELLRCAQDTALLRDTNGNVSAHVGDKIWVTPRQVDKATLQPDALISVATNTEARDNSFVSPTDCKPSIDTGVHALLYERLPYIDRVIHFHDGLVIPTATTSFPYPCGTVEEADEMCRTLAKAATRGDYLGGPFMLKLTQHGYMLGLDEEAMRRLIHDWSDARDEYVEHLLDVGEEDVAKSVLDGDGRTRLSPIFIGADVIGVFAERLTRGYASCYLMKQRRDRDYGELVMDRLLERDCLIGVRARCKVAEWYHKHGYKTLSHDDRIAVLVPPMHRDDLKAAATACLVNPIERTVLLGERLTENWKGKIALPGGHVEAGETALQAALRELKEETHIELYDPKPHAVRRFYTGTKDGGMAFSVDCHVFLTVCSPAPTKTDELDAEWVPLEEAWQRQPMDQATRRMLRDLANELPTSE